MGGIGGFLHKLVDTGPQGWGGAAHDFKSMFDPRTREGRVGLLMALSGPRGFAKPGQYHIEHMSNGLIRLHDRDSGLEQVFHGDGTPRHGAHLFDHINHVPPEPPFRGSEAPQRFSAHAGGKLSGRSEHHGFYGSKEEAQKAVEDLKNAGVPTRVRKVPKNTAPLSKKSKDDISNLLKKAGAKGTHKQRGLRG